MSSKRPAKGKSYLPFILIGGVLAAVVIAAALLLRSNNSDAAADRGAGAKANANFSSLPTGPRRANSLGAVPPHAHGPENAPVVLEEFGDFQCPPCGRMHPVVQKIEQDYGDRVRVVFRHYPLQQMHKNAFSAARAAEAAGMQGRFWEMHDAIYDAQAEWSDSPEPRPLFNNYAKRLGLNAEKFQADMARQDVADRVIADYNRGNALGVSGTPTFFLNGRELPAAKALDERLLRAEIDAALAAKAPAK